MNGNELLKRLKKIAKQRGERLEFVKKHGKGSHGTICLGNKCTTMKDRKKRSVQVSSMSCLTSLVLIKASYKVVLK